MLRLCLFEKEVSYTSLTTAHQAYLKDEEIGGGTGRYQGIELFRAALNHAGLLPLCVCMKESDMDVSPTERKNDSSISVIPPIRLQSLSEHSAIRNDDSALKCCESDSSDSNDLRHSPFTVGKVFMLLAKIFAFICNIHLESA